VKVGDLVEAIYLGDVFTEPHDQHKRGIIVEKVAMHQPYGNDAFKVVWTCGAVSERMWDYDLKKVEV
jgi:hypothetical protein